MAGDRLLKTTTSLCAVCKRAAPAELWRTGDRVVMRKVCDVHGPAEVLISSSAAWRRMNSFVETLSDSRSLGSGPSPSGSR